MTEQQQQPTAGASEQPAEAAASGGAAGATASAGAPAGGETVASAGGSDGGAPPTSITISGVETVPLRLSAAGGEGGASLPSFTTPGAGLVFVAAEGEAVTVYGSGREVARWDELTEPAWFASDAAQTYELDAGLRPAVSFYAVVDEGEPDAIGSPSRTDMGATLDAALMFSGFRDGLAPTDERVSDWYVFDVPNGSLHATLRPAANMRAALTLYTPGGEEVPGKNAFHGLPGTELTLVARRLEPGSYVLQVHNFGDLPQPSGIGAVPVNAVQPYELQITE
ncbi:MAG TPA: hypothetical protein VFQ61_06390 [Polyangiaceae bacterium]|nr:hypothetical protein [Polyangiaceae bacterium]